MRGGGLEGSATVAQQKCNRSATEVPQKCNRSATEVQQKCNRSATEVQQKCNRSATELQQKCNRSATELQQKCNRSATELQQNCNRRQTMLSVRIIFGAEVQQNCNRRQTMFSVKIILGAEARQNCNRRQTMLSVRIIWGQKCNRSATKLQQKVNCAKRKDNFGGNLQGSVGHRPQISYIYAPLPRAPTPIPMVWSQGVGGEGELGKLVHISSPSAVQKLARRSCLQQCLALQLSVCCRHYFNHGFCSGFGLVLQIYRWSGFFSWVCQSFAWFF